MNSDELELVADGDVRLGVDRFGRFSMSRYAAHDSSVVFEPSGRSRRRRRSALVSQDHVELDG